ncbi:Uncharacterised protein [Mycobacteroides abscessus]|nr:Uncharacterised protein [Mycobacteroides abscessus]
MGCCRGGPLVTTGLDVAAVVALALLAAGLGAALLLARVPGSRAPAGPPAASQAVGVLTGRAGARGAPRPLFLRAAVGK